MLRPTIGLLINNFDNEYQRAILAGVNSVCLKRDANLVCLSGGLRSNSDWVQQSQDSPLTSLAASNYDGLLMVSALVSGRLDLEDFATVVRSIVGTKPVVNLGSPHPSFSSIKAESASSIRALVEHLVLVHGRRNFVYMGGWKGNPDEEERRSTFLETLRAHGLEPADQGLLCGDFVYDRARSVLGQWLNEGRECDAIVAANDMMAYGCFDELRSRTIVVPETVSLTGYDDFSSAELFDIPLTTVNQQTQDLAALAAEDLLDQIAGAPPSGQRVFQGKPIIRQSCGCFSAETRFVEDGGSDQKTSPPQLEMDEHFDQVLQGSSTPERFLRALGATLRRTSVNSVIGEVWDHWVTTLVHRGESAPWPPRVRALLHQARIAIREAAEGRQAALRQRYVYRSRNTQAAASGLANSLTRKELFDNLEIQLPDLGLDGCLVLLFDPVEGSQNLRLIFQLSRGRQMALPPGGLEYSGAHILPESLRNDRYSFILETLFDESGPRGLVVYEFVPGSDVLIDSIGLQIRSALRSVLLMEKLEEANRQIRANQDQLVLSEKMALLGSLVTGLSHEMNTPLGVALTATSLVEEKLKKLSESLATEGGGLTDTKSIRQRVEELRAAIDLGMSGLLQVGNLVTGFRQIAVDLSGDEERLFDLGGFLKDIVQSLATVYQGGEHRFQLDCPEGLVIRSYPGVFLQILTHLTNNAVSHGFLGRNQGVIHLSVTKHAGGLSLVFEDNGRGLGAEALRHLFEPFSSALRNQPGMGLGTFVVYTLVTQKLRGRIRAESANSQGLVYRIDLPVS